MKNIQRSLSIDELINELCRKGCSHKQFYHYTTWNSIVAIMREQSFLLTRGNAMIINDQHEAIMKGSYHEWNKTFIGSFSFGSSENMAMWGLYGLPWEDAVRIAIPQSAMLRWIESIKQVDLWENNRVTESIRHFDVTLADIGYVDGIADTPVLKVKYGRDNNAILHDNETNAVDRDPRLTGYIKNIAWCYENEVRLKIRLPHEMWVEKIRVSMPKETVDAITLTTGPCFRWKSDSLYDQLDKENRISDSGFSNMVRYRPLCSLCQHRHFQRIEKHE